MRIISFKLRNIKDSKWKTVNFNHDVCILHSDANSTGKTTTLRAVLYALGFSVPGTEFVKFDRFEFELNVTVDGKDFLIQRYDNSMAINNNVFDLGTEQHDALTMIFGISNPELLDNLLGTFYFDQEKGWTLLNRGKVVGQIRFNIEAFFRGLKDDDSVESYNMVSQINALNKKIAQYNLMLDVARYQDTISQMSDSGDDSSTYDQEKEIFAAEQRNKLARVEDELAILNSIIKENKNFADFIEKKRIFVKNPSGGNPILVTKDSLFGYNEVLEMDEYRRNMLIAKRSQLKKSIASVKLEQEKQTSMFDIPTVEEEIVGKLSKVENISFVMVHKALDDMKRERKILNKELNNRTKSNNPWVKKAFESIKSYCEELGIPDAYKLDIFTSNLKGISGAILHKLVFAYKITYNKVLSEKIGYPLPIFCDSPNGREVEQNAIKEMMRILRRDFSDHQIILASIYKYEDIFDDAKIIKMNGTLFNERTIFDLDSTDK